MPVVVTMTYRDRDRVMRWLEAGHGEKLTLLDRVILRDLAEAANSDTGHAWLGQDTLSARWGVTAGAVKRTIRRLHDYGLLITAESGRWHRRARYALAGELDRVTDESPYEDPHRVTDGSQQGDRTVPTGLPTGPNRVTDGSPVSEVITKESLNHPRGRSDSAGAPSPAAEMTTDGSGQDFDPDLIRSHYADYLAPSMIQAIIDAGGQRENVTPEIRHKADDAELRKAAVEGDRFRLGDLVAGERDLIQEIAARLEMSEDDAEEWAVDKLDGRRIETSALKYLRTCIKNHQPSQAQTTSTKTPTKTHRDVVPPSPGEPWNICEWCKGAMILGLDSYPVDSPEYKESVRQAKAMIEAQARKEGGYYYHPTCWPACPKCAAPWSRIRTWPDDGICSRCKETP